MPTGAVQAKVVLVQRGPKSEQCQKRVVAVDETQNVRVTLEWCCKMRLSGGPGGWLALG
jgi:hypothetical protein